MKKLFKYIAITCFDNGMERCNNLGKKLITKQGIDSLLDVGCGDGRLTMEFAKITKPKKIFGVEFVDEYREQAESKGIKCIKSNLNEKWEFSDNSFDLIISSQNIEHIHNTRLYLEECYRCLKVGGQLIILTENLSSWVNIGALFFGWQPFSTTNINGLSIGNPFIWHSDKPKDEEFSKKWQSSGVSGTVGHVRVLTYMGLKELLEKVGFKKNVKVYSRGYLPFWGIISTLLCYIDRRHGHFLVATGFK